MLYIVCAWLCASIIFYIYGAFTARVIVFFLKSAPKRFLPPYLILWLGVICITVILSYFSIFLRISVEVSFSIFIIGIICLVVNYKFVCAMAKAHLTDIRKNNKIYFLLLGFVSLCLLLICSREPSVYDTGLYHA